MTTSVLSISNQKSFIINNAKILDKSTKLAILNIIMLEIGNSVIIEGSNELNVNLDSIEALNLEVITHIYNIVLARKAILNQPKT